MKGPALAGKVIVIMGGTSGLGLSAAKAFLAAGARVVAVGHDDTTSAAAKEALGANAVVLTADATDPKTAVAAVNVATGNFGALHALYHVAGGSGRRFGDGPLHEVTDEGWEQTVRLNLDSVFWSNRAAVTQFLKQGGGGAVLNLSSVLAFSPAPSHFSTHAYATAKAAIIGLTTSAAAYYAPRNIRFNALAPGLVATPMSQRAQGDPAIMSYVRAKQPLDGGRIGRPEDLDAAAVFLLSDESRFVTGQVLAVDGGWSVSEGIATPAEAPRPTARPAPPPAESVWRSLGRLWSRVKPRE
ncbi:MAG: SDR family oxidoreductase [Verrucomicrobia bacterium]|jgi:NAD(P)-dependent dehydrogenase (short-subunit alcohol dehydrogenase family)|nr:SDR family oxidoreductase [Verrucomicrobiota bacterium]